MLNRLKTGQGAGAGSVYIAASFAVAGALTFAFQSLCTHVLGKQGFAPLDLLWSATFLTVQVLWIGATQTLGRYVAEREAQGNDWGQVVSSVRHWQIGLVVAFVLCAVLASPLLTHELFEDPWLTVAFIVAVVFYAPEYFRRGIFNGHRQSFRLGAQIVAESSGRVLIAAVLICPRTPQSVLSPAIGALLPRASRVLSTEGRGGFDRFVAKALGVVGLVGVLMVAGIWMFGEWGLRLFAGAEFDASLAVLVALATMAAFYLLSDALNQGLFAMGRGRLAALGWFVGLLACGVCLTALGVGVVERVAYSLALGTFVAAVAQGVFYVGMRAAGR